MKPINTPVRKFRDDEPIRMRAPGGVLEWTAEDDKPGLCAYGKRHDYHLSIDDGYAVLSQYQFEGLSERVGMPDYSPVRQLRVRNTTTTLMMAEAERWEMSQ